MFWGTQKGCSSHRDFNRGKRFFCQENLYWGNRERHKRRLCKRATLFLVAPFRVAITGDSRETHDGGLWKQCISHCGRSVRGTWRRVLYCGP